MGAGLLFISRATGAMAAGLRIKDRVEHETFELNAKTMLNVVDIVTGFIVAGKIATTTFKVVHQASKGSKMAVIVQAIETGADAATVVLIGNQFLQKLEELQGELDRKEIDQATYEQRHQEILQQAAAAGLLLLVGYTAPKLSRRFGKSRQEKNELDGFKKKSKRDKHKIIDEKPKESGKFEERSLEGTDVDKQGGKSSAKGTANAAQYNKLKWSLNTKESANELVESLKSTGQLPPNYVTKGEAISGGWSPGRALGNHIPNAQIGGDIFENLDGLLPSSSGRVWYEADIGLVNTMKRSGQPGTRLLYSNDGLIYVTGNHYKSFHYLGTYK